jgi:hypothetical protein
MTNDTSRRLLSPLFVVTAVVLAIAAAGLHPALAALVDYFGKEPIPLRKKFDLFNHRAVDSFRMAPGLAGFVPISKDDEIGTDDWFEMAFRERGDSSDDSGNTLLFVTYYSDPRDTIPHTPEVCYRQGGATVDSISTVTVETPLLGPDTPQIQARLLEISWLGRRRAIVYVMVCEDEIYHDRERTRLAIGLPGNKHTYFSKVEVVGPVIGDASYDEVVERCKRLLAEVLPVLQRDHYPLGEDLQR